MSARPRRQRENPRLKPTTYDPEAVEQIVNLVQTGVSLEGAAGYAGVARQTFYRWCLNGRRHPEQYPQEAAMLERLDEALGRFEATGLLAIRRAGEQSWQAWAWLLERRFPDRYSKMVKQDVQITATSDDPRIVALHAAGFEGDASLLTEEELETLIDLMHKAIPPDRLPAVAGLPLIDAGGGANGGDTAA